MFIIEEKLFDSKRLINGYSCRNESGLRQLIVDCDLLNDEESGFAEYIIIELKNQFLCECCNTIYYDKYRSKDECDCGALICEFCEDVGDCRCKKEDLEL